MSHFQGGRRFRVGPLLTATLLASSMIAVSLPSVAAAATAPVAANDSYTTVQGTPLAVAPAGVLANDTDAENDPLSAAVVAGPANGTLVLNVDGSFSYTSNAGFSGTDSFTYTATDHPLERPPVANADAYVTNEDTPLSIASPGVLGNDTDPDADPITAVLVTGPAHGTVVLNADGSFAYTPAEDYNGPDSFTYTANDGAADSPAATVSLTVAPVNDPPQANDDSFDIDEDSGVELPAPGLLSNDDDVDGDALTATLVTEPSHGTVVLNADGSMTYMPAADFNGVDSFTYVANDGTADSAPATVTLNVTPFNDAPVAANDAYATNEDVALVVAAPGVLANDTDADADTLDVSLVTGPTHGALTLNSDGSFTYTPAADYNGPDGFTYQANDGSADSNVATVSLTVNVVDDPPLAEDDTYFVVQNSSLPIQAPGVLANDSDVDSGSLTAVLLGGPTHGTVTLNANGSFTYTPNIGYTGDDSFTYAANDGTSNSAFAFVFLHVLPVVTNVPLAVSGSRQPTAVSAVSNVATVTITVTPLAVVPVNRAPVASSDSATAVSGATLVITTPGVLANDSDPDGSSLTAVISAAAAHGTVVLAADGSYRYTSTAGFVGTDTFTYVASDGMLASPPATVTITVTGAATLPATGTDTGVGLLLGVFMLLGGAALVAVARPRRRQHRST